MIQYGIKQSNGKILWLKPGQHLERPDMISGKGVKVVSREVKDK